MLSGLPPPNDRADSTVEFAACTDSPEGPS